MSEFILYVFVFYWVPAYGYIDTMAEIYGHVILNKAKGFFND